MKVLFMYQSDFFFFNDFNKEKIFAPEVTSVYKILADISYVHQRDEQERQNYSPKTIAFIRCTDGKGQIRLKNTQIIINEDECVFLNFYDIMEYRSLTNIWGYRWVNFSTDYFGSEFELGKVYTIPFSENEDKAFNRLLAVGKSDFKNKSYLSHSFLGYFYSIMLENQLNDEIVLANAKKRIVDDICSYINQKRYSKISVEEIADFFKISPRRMHQIFTLELGISPKKYILKKKMEEGYRLLVQTSSPINEIAYMLCFSSPYHFTNEFKKTFSQSPNEIRKMQKKCDEESK
ncbi:MAG: AraC family transcriptional regulator [Eubacterium sp.]|nr:AraC family transcriptional regulator [Eubacterium sp.]